MRPWWTQISRRFVFTLCGFGLVLCTLYAGWPVLQWWPKPAHRPRQQSLEVVLEVRNPRHTEGRQESKVMLPAKAGSMKGALVGMPFEIAWDSIVIFDPRVSVGAVFKNLRWKLQMPAEYLRANAAPPEGRIESLLLSEMPTVLAHGLNPAPPGASPEDQTHWTFEIRCKSYWSSTS